MKIIDKYLIKQFIGTFVFMVLVLILITVVIDFAEKVDDFIEKKAPLEAIVFDYYFNFIPFIVNLLSPICVFMAVIFFTANLTQRSEIIAMLSGGISLYRLLRPYLFVATLLAIGSFFLNAYVVPNSTAKRIDFEYRYVKNYRLFDQRNIHKKIANNSYFYLYSYNQYIKEGMWLCLEYVDNYDVKSILRAETIQWDSVAKRWHLRTVSFRTVAGGTEKLSFQASLDTAINLTPDDIYQRENITKSLDLSQLDLYIERERSRDSDFLESLVLEKYERFAFPCAAPILTIIGVALSTRKRRGGIALQLGIGLLLSFCYIFLLFSGRLILADSVPLWLSVWLPNIVFAVLAGWLLYKAPK